MATNSEFHVPPDLVDLAVRELRSAREQATTSIELDHRIAKAAAKAASAAY